MAAEKSASVEPALRLSECLRASGEPVQAEKVLRRLIDKLGDQARDPWILGAAWLDTLLSDLRQRPKDILANLPKAAVEYSATPVVEDQFSPHVEASRVAHNPLPNSIWGTALARGPYKVLDKDIVDITLQDLGGSSPQEDPAIAGIHIRRAAPPPPLFKRGDVDGGGVVDISDPINNLSYCSCEGRSPRIPTMLAGPMQPPIASPVYLLLSALTGHHPDREKKPPGNPPQNRRAERK